MKKYAVIVLLALGVVGQTLTENCKTACVYHQKAGCNVCPDQKCGCATCSNCHSKNAHCTCKPEAQKSKVWAMAKMVTAAGIGGALMRVIDGDASKVAVIKWTMGWSMLCGLYTWAKFASSKKEYGDNCPSLLTCMTASLAGTIAGNRAPEIIGAAKSFAA